jgi:hypothetical protein
MALGNNQWRALVVLDGKLHGHFESFMLAYGFTKETLDGLLAKGLATAKPETVYSGGSRVNAIRITITSAGRRIIGSI